MNNDTSLDTTGVNRRTFLQATGAVGALSGAGVVDAKALSPEEGQSLGRVEFTEIGVTYDIETAVGSDWTLPFKTVDDLVGHSIDESEGVLYLNRFASDADVSTFERNDRVMRADDYFALPATVGTTSQHHLVTSRGSRDRVVESLSLDTRYSAPKISARSRGRRVAVQAGEREIEVASEEAQTVELPSRSVRATVRQPTDERVDAPDVPESRRPLKLREESRTLSVTPTVSVKHFSSLEVVDVSE